MSDRLVLTNSMLGNVKLCPRKAYFNYRLRMTPKARPIPLRRGSAVHNALELFYSKGIVDPKVLSKMAGDTYAERIDDAIPWMHESEVKAYEKDIALIDGIPIGYVNEYETELKYWKMLGVEQAIRMRIMHPVTGELHPKFDYAVKLDLIIEDMDEGNKHLVEHKTASQTGRAYWKKLELDPQITGYWLGCLALGHDIKSCIYNVIKMPGIRLKQTETYKDYLERLENEFSSDPEKYFLRESVYRTPEQLTHFMMSLWEWAEYITWLWEQPMSSWRKHDIGACTAWNRLCEYLEVCSRGLDGPHMMGFDQRHVLHSEYEEGDL